MQSLSLLELKLKMAEGYFLLLQRSEKSTDEEVAQAEMKMVTAHRALQAWHALPAWQRRKA